MKRSGPPKRTAPLTGATSLKRSALKATQGFKQRTAPLKRKAAVKAAGLGLPNRDIEYDYGLLVTAVCTAPHPSGRRVAVGCVKCGARSEDAHHVYPKQRLAWASVKLAEPAGRLQMDTRNVVPVCRRCHDLHESAHERLPAAAIPEAAWIFAAWLDERLGTGEATAYLERVYR